MCALHDKVHDKVAEQFGAQLLSQTVNSDWCTEQAAVFPQRPSLQWFRWVPSAHDPSSCLQAEVDEVVELLWIELCFYEYKCTADTIYSRIIAF